MSGEGPRMSLLLGNRSPNANVPVLGECELALEGEGKNSHQT